MLRVNVITLFPELFESALAISIPARAKAAGAVVYNFVNLRDFTHDRHKTVDDYAFGGGPGMVMKPQPFFEAVESIGATSPIVLMSPRGKRFSHADAVRFAACEEITFLCGHYKDVDERVAQHLATEEISLGDFVLSGGETAALAIIDAIVRLLPGAMSDHESARGDSFYDRGISAPSYTRPPEYRGAGVPDVLQSGDHAKITAWRDAESLRRTREAEARDRTEWQSREATIAERERLIAASEALESKKAAERARKKARRKRPDVR
ncbi:MAG: tRNA (guanosine(37)-N1)-methyltransferase TrmD [Gemmatimonadaceae bacterium]